MFVKNLSKVFLIFLALFSLLAVFGPRKSLAQVSTPPPDYELCGSVFDLEPLPEWESVPWVYAIGGLSRTRTRVILTYDLYFGEMFCGTREESQNQYPYCSEDETVWAQEVPDVELSQCENDKYSLTICFQGETLEVAVEDLGQYEDTQSGYTDGACVPVPTPLSCGGTTHPNADNSQCVDFSIPGGGDQGGGTTSTGQVLGASTLAATGDGNSKLGILLMVLGSALTLGSLYAVKKSSL